MILKSFEIEQCRMQGKLFERSAEEGYDSKIFIKTFMKSDIAKHIDYEFDFLQWAGEEYILETMEDEFKASLVKSEKRYNADVLYWIGYTYRLWHFYTGEKSKDIYKQAPAELMDTVYLMYHTMSCELAIDILKESYNSKCCDGKTG